MDFFVIPLAFSITFCSFFVISVINTVHAALFLILAFLQSSILLVFLGVDFLGLSIIIIYVGAISILFVFVIMLINTQLMSYNNNSLELLPFLVFIVLSVFLYFLSLFNNFLVELDTFNVFFYNDWTELFYLNLVSNLASNLFSYQVINFSVVAFILLLAMVIAIFLSNLESNANSQDLFNQICF